MRYSCKPSSSQMKSFPHFSPHVSLREQKAFLRYELLFSHHQACELHLHLQAHPYLLSYYNRNGLAFVENQRLQPLGYHLLCPPVTLPWPLPSPPAHSGAHYLHYSQELTDSPRFKNPFMERKLVWPLWKTIQRFLKKLKIELPYVPAIPPLELHISRENSNSKRYMRNSLMIQWLRLYLPMQGTQVRSLVQEDSTCLTATKPKCHNY